MGRASLKGNGDGEGLGVTLGSYMVGVDGIRTHHKLRYQPCNCGELVTYDLNCTTKCLQWSNFWNPSVHDDFPVMNGASWRYELTFATSVCYSQ